ncbi:hypothetical protein LOTGIDRAFT_234290 [Lottia gigantea]|uniref:Uncharacterized protein n=1 Tax=Lottia gigantea TaxID=225164 RepID=V4BLD7_LOTGI|nr:hypothetical protein LOTGIDRAFT_234290 [Lottia gigantea]ESO89439.1 hypothetical protein LOTGIDRAFT_234290 [Lottia gigantea]
MEEVEVQKIPSACSPARFSPKKLVQWMLCFIGLYLALNMFYARLLPLDQYTIRQYYHRISVEEDKWLVTYVPGNWTGEVTHVLDLSSWGTVLVGEAQDGPSACRPPKCFYVGPFEMEILNFSVARHLKGPQKILIGQMVAILLGAELILPFEIDRVPLESLSDMDAAAKTSGLVHTGSAVFNPYSLRTVLLTDDHIFSPASEIRPLLLSATRKTKAGNSGDDQSPEKFHLSRNGYVNLDQLDVIFHHDAFWGMIHPIMRSVLGYGELDSFWVQKVIHSMGKTVSIYNPISEPHSKSNKTNKVFAQTDIFVTDVLESLNKINCNKGTVQITKCIEHIFQEFIKRRLFPPSIFDIWNDYCKDLTAINYHFPVIDSFVVPDDFRFKLFFSARSNPNPPKRSLMKYSNILNTCKGLKFHWHDPKISDILLIITVNNADDISQLPVLDFMYRRWFQHVMFCGSDVYEFKEILSKLHYPLSLLDLYFVDGLDREGLFQQRCMMAAMVIKFGVKGYMQIKCDTLLNPWMLQNLPRDKIVLAGNMGTIDATQDKMQYWDWWAKECGKVAWSNFFTLMQQTSELEPLSASFLEIVSENTKPNTAYYSGWNIFYIPASFQENFIHAANKSLTSGLMNELALPTIVLGLQNKTGFHTIKDHSLWGEASLKFDELYNTTDIFLFQFNLRTQIKTQKGKDFFCEKYLKHSEIQLKSNKNG